MKNRDTTFDIAKGIGILCVILGHLGSDSGVRAVFPFHIPLFFIISGWFLSERMKPGPYFIKRCRSLLPAYVVTSLCLFILNVITSFIKGTTGTTALSNASSVLICALYGSGTIANHTPWGIGQIGAIWFLIATIWATSFVRWVLFITKRELVRILFVIVCFVICWQTAKYFWLPFDLQAGGCAALYVYTGWRARQCMSNTNVMKPLKKLKNYLLVLGVAVWLYCYTFNFFPNMVSAYFPHFPASVISSLIIVIAVILICKQLSHVDVVSKIFCFYGRNSLLVLCFHLMELDYFIWWPQLFNGLLLHGWSSGWIFLFIFTLKVLLCTILTLFASKLSFVRTVYDLPEAERFVNVR